MKKQDSIPTPAPTRRRASVYLLGLGLTCLVLGATATSVAVAATASVDYSWPHYRGPRSDGRSPETGLDLSWPETGPAELWRFPLGNGYSGISIAGGRAFTLFASGDDELAIALDAVTGKEVWRFRMDANRRDQFGDGPRSTPTVDGDTIYAVGALGKLYALAVASGEVRWSADLVADYGTTVPTWGVSVSPIVHGDLLLVDVGGRENYSLVAFDKATGKVRWHGGTDVPGYSTPIVASIAGQEQAVFFTGSALTGVAAKDGTALWRYPWKTSYDVNAAMPIFLSPDKLFLSSGYDVGAAVLEIVKDGDGFAVKEIWKSRVMKNHFNSSVLVADHIYGFDDGTLKCINARTGEEKWAKRGFSKGSLLYADGALIILSEKGLLVAAEATPAEYRQKASFQIFEAKTWTMPSLANGVLFVRSEKELVALDLRN